MLYMECRVGVFFMECWVGVLYMECFYTQGSKTGGGIPHHVWALDRSSLPHYVERVDLWC